MSALPCYRQLDFVVLCWVITFVVWICSRLPYGLADVDNRDRSNQCVATLRNPLGRTHTEETAVSGHAASLRTNGGLGYWASSAGDAGIFITGASV